MKNLAAFAIASLLFLSLSTLGIAAPHEKRTPEKVTYSVMEKNTPVLLFAGTIEDYHFVKAHPDLSQCDIILICADISTMLSAEQIVSAYNKPSPLLVEMEILTADYRCKPVINYPLVLNERQRDNRAFSYHQYWRNINLQPNLKV